MMIKLSKHAREQIKVRKITLEEIINCLKDPDDVLYDVKENTFVSIKRLNGKILVTIYTFEEENPKVVTVFKTDKLSMVKNRIKPGRWVRI